MSSGRTSWEPKRWSEGASDAPPALMPGLQDAQALHVDAERVARLAERLGVVGGAAGGVAATGLGVAGTGVAGTGAAGAGGVGAIAVDAAVPASGVVAYKLWAYLSGAVALSGLALLVWSEPTESVLPAPSPARVAALHESLTESASPASVGAVAAPPEVEAASAVEDGAAQPSVADRSNSKLTPETPASGPRTASRRRAVVADPPSQPLDPHAELAILNRAQDALAQAPRRALTLAEDHAEKFPEGVFAQEREVIAIGALLKLRRSDDATSRGRAFLAAFPTSTHAPRVQQMLGE